ncbi:MAG: hypothetical protein WBO73_02885 [Gammaproteobacteria bacterium]
MKQHKLQSLATEEFFYFFLRLRKGEIRRTVATLRHRYPNETEQQLAMRLIESKAKLALLGGTLMNLPHLFPGLGLVIKMIGTVGASSMMTRLNLYLILEIALVYGKDPDDQARVTEMAGVVAATGLAVAAPMLVKMFGLHPLYTLPVGGFSTTATTRLIGNAAIKLYSGNLKTHSLPGATVASPAA